MVRWCFRCGQRMSVQAQRRDSRGYMLVCEVTSCASIIRLPLCSSFEATQTRCSVCSDGQLSIHLVSMVLADSQVQLQGCLMACSSVLIRRMLQDANHLMSESELFVRVRPQRSPQTQAPSYLAPAPGVLTCCLCSTLFILFTLLSSGASLVSRTQCCRKLLEFCWAKEAASARSSRDASWKQCVAGERAVPLLPGVDWCENKQNSGKSRSSGISLFA